jgi:hypothetical protein
MLTKPLRGFDDLHIKVILGGLGVFFGSVSHGVISPIAPVHPIGRSLKALRGFSGGVAQAVDPDAFPLQSAGVTCWAHKERDAWELLAHEFGGCVAAVNCVDKRHERRGARVARVGLASKYAGAIRSIA